MSSNESPRRRVEFRLDCNLRGSAAQGAIAALQAALERRCWKDWQPNLRVLLAEGEPAWSCALPGRIPVEAVPGATDPVARALALLAPAIEGIDVVACLEPSALPIGDLEGVLERVAEELLVAGVLVERPFALQADEGGEAAWRRITSGLCPPPPLTHTCPLLDPALPLAQRVTPFAPDPAVVLVAREALEPIARHYAALAPGLTERVWEPRARHQTALALAVAQSGISTWALPLRYNLPADSIDAARMCDAVIVNLAGGSPAVATHLLADTVVTAKALDPLRRESYQACVVAHASAIADRFAGLQHAIDAAGQDPGGMAVEELRCMQAILASGLFDPIHYLAENADVVESGVDPLHHYVAHGEDQGRWPNPRFNPDFYRRRYLHGNGATSALRHYVEVGEAAGHGTQLFDPRRYLRHNPALASFVDRPLFHFLRLGHAAGLAGAPGQEAARHLAHFQRTKDTSPGALMGYKQALAQEFGVAEGFAILDETLALPECGRITLKPIRSQRDHARAAGTRYVETDPGGESLVIASVDIIGEGGRRPGTVVTRSAYVACVGDAFVRGHSAFIDVGDALLFDFEGGELENFDTAFEFDNAIFHASDARQAWVLEPEHDANCLVLESAFSLLSPRSHAFGHWMWENLPKFVAARLSGALPPMPILIDANMSRSHRASLEWMLRPGDEIIEVPNFARMRVRQLWCAPTPHFATVFEKRNAKFKWDFLMQSPARSRPIQAEMRRLADLALGPAAAELPERIYLARRMHRHAHHGLRNHVLIEALARAHGFRICYPEDLAFADQVRLIRAARFILAPEGSANYLIAFARPQTRFCILNDARTVGFSFADSGAITILFTGPVVNEHDQYGEWADYEIDVPALEGFLENWLAGADAASPPASKVPNP